LAAKWPVREAVSLPRSSALRLNGSEAQQRQPMRMALAGHQFPWAFAGTLGNPAAYEAALVQESLSYLRSFAVNKIKIDQSFIRDLTTSKESMSIVRAVTGLGQSLGIMTIAEGVETLEQLNELREVGCTEVQGYYIGRPIPANEIPAALIGFRTRA
jgi:EAL domain